MKTSVNHRHNLSNTLITVISDRIRGNLVADISDAMNDSDYTDKT